MQCTLQAGTKMIVKSNTINNFGEPAPFNTRVSGSVPHQSVYFKLNSQDLTSSSRPQDSLPVTYALGGSTGFASASGILYTLPTALSIFLINPYQPSWVSLSLLPIFPKLTLVYHGKAREFQKNIYFCFIDYAKDFDCVDHNQLWKILKEMGIPDHLTCLLRNLYTGQEATVRTGHGTTHWLQIGKGVC